MRYDIILDRNFLRTPIERLKLIVFRMGLIRLNIAEGDGNSFILQNML